VTGWYGVLAPAQTQRALINRLHAETVKALQSADVRQNLLAQGFEISPGGPDAFAAFIRTEREKWAKVVKFSGARAN
jgi:tripartite-type tricarboxylate transporter receptor subunit TctC